MPPTTHSAAQQARDALAQRLREIRHDAGLTGRGLADLAGWHESKVSKIEHGKQAPTIDDLHVWTKLCRAPRLAKELIAAQRTVDITWIEWRRMEELGLRHLQQAVHPKYQRTHRFRFYSSTVIPALIQTEAYARAVLLSVQRRRELPDDIDDAVAARLDRQRLMRERGRTFAILIEQGALYGGRGGPEVWAGQLGHLVNVAAMKNVSLGIVPFGCSREAAWPVETFYMFDDTEVNVELVSGYLTVTQSREIEMYAQVFAELAALAVHGSAARRLISAAIEATAEGQD